MSWGEAKWIKDVVMNGLKSMEKRYFTGNQKEIQIPHSTRIYPGNNIVYGLNDKEKNYAYKMNFETFKIYKTRITRAELYESGTFPVSAGTTYEETSWRTVGSGIDVQVHKKILEGVGENFEDDTETTYKYALSVKGALSYKNTGARGATIKLRINSQEERMYLVISETPNGSTITGRDGKINSIILLNEKPEVITMWVNAVQDGSYGSPAVKMGKVEYKAVKYREGADAGTNEIERAFKYVEMPEKVQGSLELNTILRGIPGSPACHNLYDGENYWICDTADIKTGKVTRRVECSRKIHMDWNTAKKPGISIPRDVDLDLVRVYIWCIVSDAITPCKYKIDKSARKVMLADDEEEISGDYNIYVAYPMEESEEKQSVLITKSLDYTFQPNEMYDIQSSMIFPYMQALTDEGEIKLQSFLCASENMDKLKHGLTGRIPTSEPPSFHEVANCAELENLESKYAVFLNHTNEFGISSAPKRTCDFVEGKAYVTYEYDYDIDKLVVRSYLRPENVRVSTLNIGTDTDSIQYLANIHKVTDSSGYITYYSMKTETGYDQDRYLRPFKVSAAGVLTFGTAMKLLAADSDATRYYVNEVPSMYDPYGVCFLIEKENYTKYTVDGNVYYDKASVVTYMRTVYFRPNDNTYTNLNSQGDTVLGTDYEVGLVNGVAQSPGKTSVIVSPIWAPCYGIGKLSGGKIFLEAGTRLRTPFFKRDDRVHNADDIITKETKYTYANLGAWREAPTSYNYQTCTYNPSTGETAYTVDKPMDIPWMMEGKELARVIRNGEGTYFVVWRGTKREQGKIQPLDYVSDWYDSYTEIWEYCPVTYNFYKTDKKLSDFV